MAVNYYEKQRALVNLALALKEAGWTIHGFHEDKSDAMVDYFQPASWSSHATHKDYPGIKIVGAFCTKRYNTTEDAPVTETPKGKMWHMEASGRLVDSGTGFSDCCDHRNGLPAARRIVAEINRTAKRRTENAKPAAVAANGNAPAFTPDNNWLWLKFPQKPSEAVRMQLRGITNQTANWSSSRQAWYCTDATYFPAVRAIFGSLIEAA